MGDERTESKTVSIDSKSTLHYSIVDKNYLIGCCSIRQ